MSCMQKRAGHATHSMVNRTLLQHKKAVGVGTGPTWQSPRPPSTNPTHAPLRFQMALSASPEPALPRRSPSTADMTVLSKRSVSQLSFAPSDDSRSSTPFFFSRTTLGGDGTPAGRLYNPLLFFTEPSVAGIVVPGSPFSRMYWQASTGPALGSIKMLLERTVCIFVHALCLAESPSAAAGIFFGPGSPHNAILAPHEHYPEPPDHPLTQAHVEYAATIRALELVTACSTQEDHIDRVIVATPAAHLVELMTSNEAMAHGRASGWKDEDGHLMENADLIKQLDEVIRLMDRMHDIEVRLWLIKEGENVDAKSLAESCWLAEE